MTCESDDPEIQEIDRKLESILGPPRCPSRRAPVTPSALDRILGSRSHVRVLRIVLRDADRENLSAREIGRRASVTHPRTLKVLRELEAEAIVTAYREPGWSMYRPNHGHPLTDAVRALFAAEREVSAPQAAG